MITQIIILLLTLSSLAEANIHVTGTTKKVNGVILQNLDDMMVNAAKMTRNFFARSEMNWWNRMWDRTDYHKNVVYYDRKVNAAAASLKRNLAGTVKNPKEIAYRLNKLVRSGTVIAHSLSRRSTVPKNEMKVIGRTFYDASKVLAKTFTRKWMEDIHQCYLSQYFYQINKDYLHEVRYNAYLNALAGQRSESRICAQEGGTCKCNGSVKYGAGQKWTRSKNVKRSIRCDNKNFGDVYRGTKKSCVCKTPLLTHRSNFRRFMVLQQEMVEDSSQMSTQPNMPSMNDFLEANEFEEVMDVQEEAPSFDSNEFEGLMDVNFDDDDEIESEPMADETEGFNVDLMPNEFEAETFNFDSMDETNEFEADAEVVGEANEFEAFEADAEVFDETNEFEADAEVFDAEMQAEVEGENFFSMAATEDFDADSMENEFETVVADEAEGFNFASIPEANEFEAEVDGENFFSMAATEDFDADSMENEFETVADEAEGFNFASIPEANEFEADAEEAEEAVFNFESMPEANEFEADTEEASFNFESMFEANEETVVDEAEGFNFESMPEANEFETDEEAVFNFESMPEANEFEADAEEASFNFESMAEANEEFETEGFNFESMPEANEFEADAEEASFNFESMAEANEEFETVVDEAEGFNFGSMPEANEFAETVEANDVEEAEFNFEDYLNFQ